MTTKVYDRVLKRFVDAAPTGGAVSLNQLDPIATNTLLGRASSGSGVVEVLNAAAVRSILSINNLNNTADTDKPVSTAMAAALSGKQATLVSGSNISTINGQTLLSGGNITISGGSGGGAGTILQNELTPTVRTEELKLAFIESNGSTATVDASATVKTVTLTNAIVSTEQQKFGTGSLKTIGNGYAAITHANFSMTNANFKFGFFIYPLSYVSTYNTFLDSRTADGDSAGFAFGMNTSGQLYIYRAGFIISAAGNVPLNTWSYVCLYYFNGIFYLRIGIAMVGQVSSPAAITNTSLRLMNSWNATNGINGYIDSVLLEKFTVETLTIPTGE